MAFSKSNNIYFIIGVLVIIFIISLFFQYKEAFFNSELESDVIRTISQPDIKDCSCKWADNFTNKLKCYCKATPDAKFKSVWSVLDLDKCVDKTNLSVVNGNVTCSIAPNSSPIATTL
jgi:hypothetical protein